MKAFANGVWEHRIKQIARFGYHRSIIAYSLLTVCDGEGWIRVHSPTVQNPASATSRALLKRPQAHNEKKKKKKKKIHPITFF
jgi:hypothetical protein